MDIKIIVAAHKPYQMPRDPMYLPVHVGSEGKTPLEYVGDNTGDNISARNPHYCELTGLYWAWKNLKADYVGLVHYRRHFVLPGSRGEKFDRVLTQSQLEPLLGRDPVILPKKRHYWIETNYSQYAHAHHGVDLDTTRAILEEDQNRAYLDAYDALMGQTSGHRFNMFIMRWDLFDGYCEWLFHVLFELERRLDISAYSAYDARVFGFVSERLLDVWMTANAVDYKELPVLYMERQNWLVKGGNFLKRKLLGGKA